MVGCCWIRWRVRLPCVRVLGRGFGGFGADLVEFRHRLGPGRDTWPAASKQMPIAIITPTVTAHRPRPVMNEPPISPTPWPRMMPPTTISRRPRPRAMPRSISTTSVAIELDQPLVADPEVMRDLVEHDVPDLAA